MPDLHVCQVHRPPTPVVTGAGTVNIGFQPAARVGDQAACPARAKIAVGSVNVRIEGKQAARLGDETNPKGLVVTGFPTVIIGSTSEIEALVAPARGGGAFRECK